MATSLHLLIHIFDQKDSNCHTFKKSENKIKSGNSVYHDDDDLGAVEASLGTHCPPSPSSQTESNVSLHGDFSPNIEMGVVQITNQEVAAENSYEINSHATCMISTTIVYY
jgi:hypothetical protein